MERLLPISSCEECYFFYKGNSDVGNSSPQIICCNNLKRNLLLHEYNPKLRENPIPKCCPLQSLVKVEINETI